MPGSIQHLPRTASALGEWDPRWKLAALLVFGVAVISLRNLAPTLTAFLGAVILAGVGCLPARWTLSRLGLVLLVLAPFLILLPFVQATPGTGLLAAGQLALKTLTLTLIVLVVLATSPLHDTFKAAQSLRLPGLFVHLALLTYRYVFVLAGELARLRIALRVRGYRNRPNLHCYRTVGHVTGTLLVRGYEQAERVEQAMRCRGFDGHFRTLTSFRTRPADVVAFLAIGFLAVALLVWDY